MKVRDLIKEYPEILSEDVCNLCKLHEVYQNIETHIKCPNCQTAIFFDDSLTVVGESNAMKDDENINKYLVTRCQKCATVLAAIPTPIIYNANHDVYYTGGRKYVIGKIPFENRLTPAIEQYTQRILQGEKLEPLILKTWLKYEIEEIIANFLYENNLKK